LSSSVPGFYNAPVADFYILLESGQMKLIDEMHSNVVVKTTFLAKSPCFFKSSFVWDDFKRAGYNYDKYFGDIANLNPSQIKIDRNSIGAQDVLISPYYTLSSDMFNFKSQYVCFVTGSTAEFEKNIDYC